MIAKNKRLQWYAERCIGSNHEEALKQLTAITRDLYACDRDQMYFYLIQLNSKSHAILFIWLVQKHKGLISAPFDNQKDVNPVQSIEMTPFYILTQRVQY